MTRLDRIVFLTDEVAHALTSSGNGRPPDSTCSLRLSLPDSLAASFDRDVLAETVAEAFRQAGGTAGSIVLVIPLQWCFVEQLPAQRRVSAEALAFQLEPLLPMPLEEVTCAFCPASQGSVWAAAIPTQPMRELLDAFLRHGLQVQRIAVDALMAAEVLGGDENTEGVILLDHRWARAVACQPDSTASTSVTLSVSGPQSLALRIANRLGIEPSNESIGFSRWTLCRLFENPEEDSSNAESVDFSCERVFSFDETMSSFAETLLVRPPALDLCTGALSATSPTETIHRLARHCLGWAAAMLLLLIVGMHVHNRTLHHQLQDMESAKLAAYRLVFDTKALPMGAALRLASERLRLDALAHVDSKSSKSIQNKLPPPLKVLREVVASLPADLPVMLAEARLDDRQMTLRGQTREHTDAERIVATINGLPGLNAPPPRTNRLKSGGVEFSIVAGTSDGR